MNIAGTTTAIIIIAKISLLDISNTHNLPHPNVQGSPCATLSNYAASSNQPKTINL
jgi:hypothetical protein